MKRWMIYGATGYSGQMIAEKAVAHGLTPLLGGRSTATAKLADRLGLEARIFSLDDAAEIEQGLAGLTLLLNCAGPFSATARPMISGCLAMGVHYLDITGEIDVFTLAHGFDQAARDKGLLLCPGVGFDVVPTDCVAAALLEAMPDANSLCLAFDSRSPLSHGTASTMVEALGQGGKVRRGGEILTVPFAYDVRRIDFGRGAKTSVSIPWGDVASAYYSTGIPDITVYIASSSRAARRLKRLNWLRPILAWPWLQGLMKRRIGHGGPDERKRNERSVYLWGEVRNRLSERRVARLETPNGYSFTVESALAISRFVLEQQPPAVGYRTPSQLTGWRFVETLPGVGKVSIALG